MAYFEAGGMRVLGGCALADDGEGEPVELKIELEKYEAAKLGGLYHFDFIGPNGCRIPSASFSHSTAISR
jgi:hypothetical protein